MSRTAFLARTLGVLLLLSAAVHAQTMIYGQGALEVAVLDITDEAHPDTLQHHAVTGPLDDVLAPSAAARGFAARVGDAAGDGSLFLALGVADHPGAATTDVFVFWIPDDARPFPAQPYDWWLGYDAHFVMLQGVAPGAVSLAADAALIQAWIDGAAADLVVASGQGHLIFDVFGDDGVEARFWGFYGDGPEVFSGSFQLADTVTAGETFSFGQLKRAWR